MKVRNEKERNPKNYKCCHRQWDRLEENVGYDMVVRLQDEMESNCNTVVSRVGSVESLQKTRNVMGDNN